MLDGKHICLRSVEATDLNQLKQWRNNEKFRKNFREYRELNTVDQQNWFDKYVIKDPNTLMFSICLQNTGELIGACGLCYINWVQRNADLSLYIGKDDIYVDEDNKNGLAYDTLDVLTHYAFCTLNLHKVWTELYCFDTKKNKLISDYGFKVDGILRDNVFYDNKYHNSNLYSLLSSEHPNANQTDTK